MPITKWKKPICMILTLWHYEKGKTGERRKINGYQGGDKDKYIGRT